MTSPYDQYIIDNKNKYLDNKCHSANPNTQTALARSLGVSSNAVSALEAGRLKLSARMGAKIKEVYGEKVTVPATSPVQKEAKKSAPEKQSPPIVILQSPFGGEITVNIVTSIAGEVGRIYVRIDQNKLYWDTGEEIGAIDIW